MRKSHFVWLCVVLSFVVSFTSVSLVQANTNSNVPLPVQWAASSVFKVVPLLYPPVEIPIEDAKSKLNEYQISTTDPKAKTSDILLELLRQSYWKAVQEKRSNILLHADTSGTAFAIGDGKRLLSAAHTFRPAIKQVGKSYYTASHESETTFNPGRFMGRPIERDPQVNQEIIQKLHQIPAHFLLVDSNGKNVFDSRKDPDNCSYRQIGITDAFESPMISYQGETRELPWFMTRYAYDYIVIDCKNALTNHPLSVRSFSEAPIRNGEKLYSIGHMDKQVEIAEVTYEENNDWAYYEKRDMRTTTQSAWLEEKSANHILFVAHGKVRPGFSGGPTVTSSGQVFGLTNHGDLITGKETSVGVTLQYIDSVLKKY